MLKNKQNLIPGWMLLVAFALLLSPMFDTAQLLGAVWQNNDKPYTHGLLMLCLSLYLLVQVRLEPYRTSFIEKKLCILAYFIGLTLWLVGNIVLIEIFTFLALPCIILSTLYYAFGRFMLLPSLFMGVFYLLSIPVWAAVIPVLQALTVFFAGGMAKLTGITAYIDQIYVHLASGILVVEGGCAGLNYFLSAIALGLMMAYMRRLYPAAIVIVVISAGLLAMAANWVRVYLLILIADATQMEHYLIAVSHVEFGWVVFGVIFFPFLILGMRYKGFSERPETPIVELSIKSLHRSVFIKLAASFVVIACIVVLFKSVQGQSREVDSLRVSLESSIIQPAPALNLQMDAPDTARHWRYFSDVATYNISMFTYVNETRDRQLLGYFNRPFDGKNLSTMGNIIFSPKIAMEQAIIEDDNKKYFAVYGYKIGKRLSSSKFKAQLSRLHNWKYKHGENAFLIIYVECESDCLSEKAKLFGMERGEIVTILSQFGFNVASDQEAKR